MSKSNKMLDNGSTQTDEQLSLEELLNDAFENFNIQTASTEMIQNANTVNDTIETGSNTLPNATDIDQTFSTDKTDDVEETNTIDCGDINNVYVDQLLNDFQQKLKDIMGNEIGPLNIDKNDGPNSKLLIDEMQKVFHEMVQDTVNNLMNERTQKQKSDSCSSTDIKKNSVTDFKSVMSQAVKNLSANLDVLNDSVITGSSDDINMDEDEMEEHFTEMFITIGRGLLYVPIKAMCDKYPSYLKENEDKLLKNTFNNYTNQYLKMVELCEIFENNDNKARSSKIENILAIMEELPKYGLPPNELIDTDVKPCDC